MLIAIAWKSKHIKPSIPVYISLFQFSCDIVVHLHCKKKSAEIMGSVYRYDQSSPLSNFHRFCFKWMGQQFNTTEAAYQYEKALHYGLNDLAHDILQSNRGQDALHLANIRMTHGKSCIRFFL